MWSAFLLFRYAPLQCGLPFVRTTRDRVHALSRFAIFAFTLHLALQGIEAEEVKGEGIGRKCKGFCSPGKCNEQATK